MRTFSCDALRAIARYAEVAPQAPALIEPDGITLNYKELLDQIEAVSRRLREAGIGPGQRVAVLLPQGALQVLAVTGVLSEHVAIPLQSRATTDEVESHLRRLAPSALIVSSEHEAEARSAGELGLAVLIARLDQPPQAWDLRFGSAPLSQAAQQSDAALCLITSATTGHSKVVPLTTANLDAGIESRRQTLHLTASDRLLLMTSFCHIIGVENALAQFAVGGVVIATGGFDPARYLHWLNELGPTWYDCAPTVHQAALAQLKSTLLEMPVSLRFLQSAGAPLPEEVRQGLEQVLQVPVFNDYGMTEACPIAVDAYLDGERVANSAGRSAGLEIGIMSSSGDLLQAGEEGEIAVRGAAVFPGYEDDAAANRSAFLDGWFRTGDLGHLDREGNLFVTGRLKEMINRGGEKILPGEVDAAFESHPAVLEAAAFAVPHPTLGEDVACAIVLRAGTESQVSPRELRRYATQHLASFKVPHRIHFVDEIPRGELGKPQRWLLTERLSGRSAAAPTPAEISEQIAVNELVFYLHEIWERILDRDDLGFDEDFFEAGGDSLAAVNMLAEVDLRFGSQTSGAAASFIDEPTLAHLAGLVGNPSPPRPSVNDSGDIRIFPVREGGSGMRLFCFPPDGVEGLSFRRMARHLQGEIDLSVVRPANAWYGRSLFTFEHTGAEAAALIRRAQPHGPYFLSGYCFGGVVAVEAARHLSLEGQDVRVILIDTPMPGFPGFLREGRVWIEGARRQWHRLWTNDHPGLTRNLRRFFRLLLWYAVVPFRTTLALVERVSAIQRILQWAQADYFPFYKRSPVDASFLHILSMNEPNAIESASRFGWRKIARRGITERFVACDHFNVLHELNLPETVRVLTTWDGAHESRRQNGPPKTMNPPGIA
jgi:acyl-CoA synthetase (AMP-forming)/AMP-acid ligase II/thioesterase domain-containing protein